MYLLYAGLQDEKQDISLYVHLQSPFKLVTPNTFSISNQFKCLNGNVTLLLQVPTHMPHPLNTVSQISINHSGSIDFITTKWWTKICEHRNCYQHFHSWFSYKLRCKITTRYYKCNYFVTKLFTKLPLTFGHYFFPSACLFLGQDTGTTPGKEENPKIDEKYFWISLDSGLLRSEWGVGIFQIFVPKKQLFLDWMVKQMGGAFGPFIRPYPCIPPIWQSTTLHNQKINTRRSLK